MGLVERLLIYDSGCPFCEGLARMLQSHLDIAIIANHKCKIKGIQTQIKSDVHLVIETGYGQTVYSGADAAAKVLSFKYNFIWTIYSLQPFRGCFKGIYWILKKSRKFL